MEQMQDEMTDELQDRYDAVVVGGGAAGLNAALMLGRSRRSVVVVDSGRPRNAPAAAVHGLFAREGTPPAELLATGRREVRQYGGHVVRGEVARLRRVDDGFALGLVDGRTTRARRVVVASGVVDELPPVPGLAQRWGRDVVHCPYCHGYEVRDRAIGVLASGPMSVHQTLIFSQLTDDLVLFTHDQALAEEDAEKLAAIGVRVVAGPVGEVVVEDDRITGLRLADGTVVPREVVAVGSRPRARADFLAEVGLHLQEHPSGVGEHLPADPTGRSEVAGIWVAGNANDLMGQVGAAAAAGAMAGAQVNADLIMEDAARAVGVHRS